MASNMVSFGWIVLYCTYTIRNSYLISLPQLRGCAGSEALTAHLGSIRRIIEAPRGVGERLGMLRDFN